MLALAQQGISISDEPKKKVNNTAKAKPGVMFGAGFNASNPKRDNNVQTSIISAATKSAFMQQLGIFYLIPVSTSISFRPVLNLQLGSIDVQFQRTGSTGGPVINETITLKTPLLNFSPGFIYNLKSTASYILVSPSISYKLNEDEPELPLKKYSMSADVGAGLNLSLKRPGLILTPEIKLAIGITDIKEQSSSIYASALSSLKNSAFSLSIYLRKK
jgi:hypothetical protein